MGKHPGRCPRCGYQLAYETAVGEQVVCPQCQMALAVPGKEKRSDRVDPLLGTQLGQYEIVELIGRGGMAAVYRATQKSLGRPCAIKVLPAALAKDASFAARFQREARSAAAVMHPNVIEIYDVGQQGGFQYIAMELVEGESLADVLWRDGPLPPDRALECMRQTAAALAAAHARGIVHRDIKPSNILVTPQGMVKVVDFGLAKRMGGDTGVTRTGQIVGTALYLPPEVALGQAADARSDLYSLGGTFYHLLSGAAPFEATSVAEMILKHTEAEPTPLGEIAPAVPPALCQVIHRLLRKRPEERYRSAEELLDALARAERAFGAPAPPPTPVPLPSLPAQGIPSIAPPPPQAEAAPAPLPEGGVPSIAPPPAPHGVPSRLGHPPGAYHPPGEHVHHTLEEWQAAHRKEQTRMAIYMALGAAAGVAAIVGLIVLASLAGSGTHTRSRQQPEVDIAPDAPEPEPQNPVLALMEENARVLFRDARRAAAEGDKWLSVESFLRRLRTEYAKTKYYAANRAAIDDLWAKTQAALSPEEPAPTTAAPPAPPDTPTPAPLPQPPPPAPKETPAPPAPEETPAPPAPPGK